MRENSKYSMSLTYGPKEDQLWNTIDQLGQKQLLPENRNEILRRGLYSVRYLAEVDETLLLLLLKEQLNLLAEKFSFPSLNIAKSLSYAIFASMIAKEGISKAEAFSTIPITLATYEHTLLEGKVEVSEIEPQIKKSIENLAVSVDTVFLDPLLGDTKDDLEEERRTGRTKRTLRKLLEDVEEKIVSRKEILEKPV